MIGKNAIGFGLGLSGLLLVAAASWISVALSAIPHFLDDVRWVSRALLLGVQLGISGLVAGWLSYELTPRVANGNGILRVALMTLFATACAVASSLVCSLIVWPFSMRIVAVYFLLLPLPCLALVPVWAIVYLRLIRLQETLEQLVPRNGARMAQLLAELRKSSGNTL